MRKIIWLLILILIVVSVSGCNAPSQKKDAPAAAEETTPYVPEAEKSGAELGDAPEVEEYEVKEVGTLNEPDWTQDVKVEKKVIDEPFLKEVKSTEKPITTPKPPVVKDLGTEKKVVKDAFEEFKQTDKDEYEKFKNGKKIKKPGKHTTKPHKSDKKPRIPRNPNDSKKPKKVVGF